MFDRTIYFDRVRASLFGGALKQHQVDGQNVILGVWEAAPPGDDLRWLAYMLSTTYFEVAKTMQPVAERGKGSGKPYGVPAANGNIYYGRGYVQLTWEENYLKADQRMGWTGEASCALHPDLQLTAAYAAPTMFLGMAEGWFRRSKDGQPHSLPRYFSPTADDALNAREIINGDKTKVPKWSAGVSVGELLAGYHGKFLDALIASWRSPAAPPAPATVVIDVNLRLHIAPDGELTVELISATKD